MTIISGLKIEIHARTSPWDGHPCSGISYVWTQDGKERYAYTRLNYPTPQGPHQIAVERAAFLRRNGYTEAL